MNYLPVIIPVNKNSSNAQYNIELCKTLETSHEIRECLESARQKELHHDAIFAIVIIMFVLAIIVHFYIENRN